MRVVGEQPDSRFSSKAFLHRHAASPEVPSVLEQIDPEIQVGRKSEQIDPEIQVGRKSEQIDPEIQVGRLSR
jgi:hypothetical protein